MALKKIKSFYFICYIICDLFVILGIPRMNSIGKISDCGSTVADNLPNSEEALSRGEYAVIRSLIRVLEVVWRTFILILHGPEFQQLNFTIVLVCDFVLGWCWRKKASGQSHWQMLLHAGNRSVIFCAGIGKVLVLVASCPILSFSAQFITRSIIIKSFCSWTYSTHLWIMLFLKREIWYLGAYWVPYFHLWYLGYN